MLCVVREQQKHGLREELKKKKKKICKEGKIFIDVSKLFC